MLPVKSNSLTFIFPVLAVCLLAGCKTVHLSEQSTVNSTKESFDKAANVTPDMTLSAGYIVGVLTSKDSCSSNPIVKLKILSMSDEAVADAIQHNAVISVGSEVQILSSKSWDKLANYQIDQSIGNDRYSNGQETFGYSSSEANANKANANEEYEKEQKALVEAREDIQKNGSIVPESCLGNGNFVSPLSSYVHWKKSMLPAKTSPQATAKLETPDADAMYVEIERKHIDFKKSSNKVITVNKLPVIIAGERMIFLKFKTAPAFLGHGHPLTYKRNNNNLVYYNMGGTFYISKNPQQDKNFDTSTEYKYTLVDGSAVNLSGVITDSSDLNDYGWTAYGRIKNGTFEISGLEPYKLLKVATTLDDDHAVNIPFKGWGSDDIQPRPNSLVDGYYHKVWDQNESVENKVPNGGYALKKGRVFRTYLGDFSRTEHSEKTTVTNSFLQAMDQDANRFLVLHLFGHSTHREQRRPFVLIGSKYVSTGHYSFGEAKIIPHPFTKKMYFDITYHQVYAHLSQGITSASVKYNDYTGGLVRGKGYLLPVSDIIINVPELNQNLPLADGSKVNLFDAFVDNLERVMAAYRVGLQSDIQFLYHNDIRAFESRSQIAGERKIGNNRSRNNQSRNKRSRNNQYTPVTRPAPPISDGKSLVTLDYSCAQDSYRALQFAASEFKQAGFSGQNTSRIKTLIENVTDGVNKPKVGDPQDEIFLETISLFKPNAKTTFPLRTQLELLYGLAKQGHPMIGIHSFIYGDGDQSLHPKSPTSILIKPKLN